MKRMLAIVLVLCLMAVPLAGCESAPQGEIVGEGEADFEEAEIQDEDVNVEELPEFKFAFTYYSFEDKLGGQFKQCIQYLCDAYNCEVVFFETGFGDEAISNTESVLVAGDIDALLTVGVTPAQMEVAKTYDVPVVSVCGFPSVEEEITGVASYENFLGGVIDDDTWAGEHCIEALYEAGCRNICFSGLTIGMLKSHDDRMNAMKRIVAKHDDFNLLADSYTMAEAANDIATFNASFSEMDGIGFSAMSDAVYLAFENEGIADGSVKISGVDISSQTGAYFENGVQVWTCGGQYATAMVGWAVAYNYLMDGTRIIENTAEPIVRKYIEITSYDEYKQYVEYVESPIPTYNADEIAQMIHYFNPDATIEDYYADADNYSLQDIIDRRTE